MHYSLLAKLSLMAYALASVILTISTFVLDGSALISATPLTIGVIQVDRSEAISWVSLLAAVVILPISVLMSAQRFGERALLMRACESGFGLLEEEAKISEKEKDPKRIERVAQTYFLILALTENHKEVDFQYYRADKRRASSTPVKVKHSIIWWHKLLLFFWWAVGIVLPIIIVVGVFLLILHP